MGADSPRSPDVLQRLAGLQLPCGTTANRRNRSSEKAEDGSRKDKTTQILSRETYCGVMQLATFSW
ncbi:MAG: hypothetical protein JWR48_57 [Mycobacterium sp.]|nr:hypothetical protein [Mycobacterium sp.]